MPLYSHNRLYITYYIDRENGYIFEVYIFACIHMQKGDDQHIIYIYIYMMRNALCEYKDMEANYPLHSMSLFYTTLLDDSTHVTGGAAIDLPRH